LCCAIRQLSTQGELRQLGGKWNGSLGGWIFSKKKEDEIRKALREFL